MYDQSLSGHGRATRVRTALSIFVLLSMSLAVAAGSRAEERQQWAAGEPVMVTTAGGSHPTVSPDGEWVAYQVDGGISRIPAVGGEAQVLVGSGREPDWSRTGNLIVYRADEGIYTVDAVTLAVNLLLSPGGWDDDPAWSPLGNEIAIQSSSNSVSVISYPGGQLTWIPCLDPDNSACDGEGPTWAPDGLWLAFQDGADLLKMPRAGGTAVNLYSYVGSRTITQPAWSWAGRWIAVARTSDAFDRNLDIWVVDARGAAQGLLQVTAGPDWDSQPAWSPDGGTIYFSSSRSGSGQIWKVEAPPVPVNRNSWGSLKAGYR